MFRKWIALAFLLSWTNSAYCLINAEAFYGKRWYQTKDSNGSKLRPTGTDVTIGVNIDPIPLVPVSFGVSYSLIELNKSGLGSASVAEINQFGLDLKIWAPMVPIVTPYVRGRYILSSKLKISYDNDSTMNTNTKISGYVVGLGVDYKIVPMFHAQLELNQSWAKADSFEGKKQDFDSTAILIGLLIGV